MSYCSILQLNEAYGEKLFERICVRSDDTMPLDPLVLAARKQAALDEASGLMDSYFQTNYNVPVVTTFDAGLLVLRDCCGVLAVASLVRRKGYVSHSEDESLVIAADVWRKWLRDIKSGDAQVPGASLTDGQLQPGTSAPRTGMLVASQEPEIYQLQARYY